MFDLKGKTALVTGASQGIGRAIALALAKSGARVAVAARNVRRLKASRGKLQLPGARRSRLRMDVAEAEQVKAGFREAVEKFGRLDILVNNAALTRDGLAVRMKPDDWDAVLRTNLTGAHFCAQQALATMLRQRYGPNHQCDFGGGGDGQPGQVNYVAAKAGLIGLTRALAVEMASRNITVNAVAPGFIVSPMTDPLPQKVKDGFDGAHSPGAHGDGRGSGSSDGISGERRSGLYHGRGAGREWRLADGLRRRRRWRG